MMKKVLLACVALLGVQQANAQVKFNNFTALQTVVLIGTAFDAIEFDVPETPITIRMTDLIQAVQWNCVATYSEQYLDALTMKRPRVKMDPEWHQLDNQVFCGLQATVTLLQGLYESLAKATVGILESQLGLQGTEVEDPLVTACRLDGCTVLASGFCYDRKCLKAAAKNNPNPFVVGQVTAHLALEYASKDGFNANGNETETCTSNCRPFSDTTGYKVKNTPWDKNKHATRWQPLLEDDGRGFFYYQQHVTPHIGKRGKLRVLSKQEFKSRETPEPDYDYDAESELLMERLNQLNDYKKTEIEFFNNKLVVDRWIRLSALPFLPGLSYAEGQLVAVALTAIEHDATLLAWKEKVKHDLVRPTTWIQQMEDGEKVIETYAGPFQGIQVMESKDFQPYIRVMPHSEYPSGSACICTTVNEFVAEYFRFKNITTPIPIRIPIPSGSSKVEPGVVPAQDMLLSYNSWEEYAKACGESRLNGGMHFTASVTAGEEVVKGMGAMALDYARTLSANQLPAST